MSTLASWSYAEGPATVWPSSGTDEWGQPTGRAPYLIPAIDYEHGGEVQRDANGTQFVPQTTIYFEAAFDSDIVPKRDWFILPGDHLGSATPPENAERIRTVEAWPMQKFGAGQLPDWRVTT